MERFDGWNTPYFGDYLAYDQDSLMHFRTKGSKNGVRRYQNTDGTWTPLGLRERRVREGWGERRAKRRAARAEAKTEKRAARAERIAQYKAEQAERNRLKHPERMTDAELKKAIARVNMEQEYKALTRSPLLEIGERAVKAYLGYREGKAQRKLEEERMSLERMKVAAQFKQASSSVQKARYEAKAARSEFKKKVADVKGGLKAERKAQLTNARTAYRGTTILGAIGKGINNLVKYRQEERMNPLEAKKAQRVARQTELQNEKQRLITEAERQKARQEKWKSKGKSKS